MEDVRVRVGEEVRREGEGERVTCEDFEEKFFRFKQKGRAVGSNYDG